MTDWLDTVKHIVTTPQELADVETLAPITPKTVHANLTCVYENFDEDYILDTPCGWSGAATVTVWADSREAIWYCPHGHENCEPFRDFE